MQVATAVGTVATVIVALFGDWLQAQLIPPKLLIGLKSEIGDIEKTETGLDSRYYRISVRNLRRWPPAKEVELLLLRLADPPDQPPKRIDSIPLQWTHQPIKPLRPTIARSGDYECDLFSVTKMSDGKSQLQLHPLIQPFSLKTVWDAACKFTVTLQARSLQTESNLLSVQIAWNGQWTNDAVAIKAQSQPQG